MIKKMFFGTLFFCLIVNCVYSQTQTEKYHSNVINKYVTFKKGLWRSEDKALLFDAWEFIEKSDKVIIFGCSTKEEDASFKDKGKSLRYKRAEFVKQDFLNKQKNNNKDYELNIKIGEDLKEKNPLVRVSIKKTLSSDEKFCYLEAELEKKINNSFEVLSLGIGKVKNRSELIETKMKILEKKISSLSEKENIKWIFFVFLGLLIVFNLFNIYQNNLSKFKFLKNGNAKQAKNEKKNPNKFDFDCKQDSVLIHETDKIIPITVSLNDLNDEIFVWPKDVLGIANMVFDKKYSDQFGKCPFCKTMNIKGKNYFKHLLKCKTCSNFLKDKKLNYKNAEYELVISVLRLKKELPQEKFQKLKKILLEKAKKRKEIKSCDKIDKKSCINDSKTVIVL